METKSSRRATAFLGRLFSAVAVISLAGVAAIAGGASPVSAGTSPPNCPSTTFNVSTDAELFAAITCFNGTTTAGVWTIDVGAEITYTSAGLPIISNSTSGVSLVIDGDGRTLDAAGLSRVLIVQGGNVTVQDIVLTGGSAPGAFAIGGGLWASNGTVLLQNSLVTGNTAGSGGGVAANGATITVLNSTVSGNTGTARGGGLHNESFSTPLNVIYSTVFDNDAPVGAGISTWGSNSISTPANGTRIAASIVTLNTGGGTDLELAYETTKDTFTSGGYNIVGSVGAGMSAITAPDIQSSMPIITGLSTRAGTYFPQAHHPLSGSAAIDGVTGTPNLFGVPSPTTDQASKSRSVGTNKDIGAAEGYASVTISVSNDPPDGTDFPFSATLAGYFFVSSPTLDHAVPDDGDSFNQSQYYGSVEAGSNTITETVPFGWQLNSAICTGGASSGSLSGSTLTINSQIGEDISCVFDNNIPCTGFPMTVMTLDRLNDAIGCFNAETTPGTYEIILGSDITYLGGDDSLPIDNSTSSVNLKITGNGHTLNAFDDHVGGTATTTDAVLTINNGTVVINNATLTGADRGNNFNGGGIQNEGGKLTLSSVTLTNNLARSGGGVYNGGGELLVVNSYIDNNTGSTGGGGIYSGVGSPTLSVINSQIVQNHATVFTNAGGGIHVGGGTANITGSAIVQNDGIHGGGIFNAGDTAIIRSTIAENVATLRGGGIAHDGFLSDLNIINSTISLNEVTGATGKGGGLWAPAGDITISHSTVAHNEAPDGAGLSSGGSSFPIVKLAASIVSQNGLISAGGDIEVDTTTSTHQPFISGNFNVLGTVPGAFGAGADDLLGVDPLLEGLASYYSDVVATHRLNAASPAIDHITGSPNFFGTAPIVFSADQVGTSRPQGAFGDVGAIEFRATPLLLIDPGCLVYDSNGDVAGSLSAGVPRVIEVAGTGLCVPEYATAVVLTATAKSPQGAGNLRLSAEGVTPTGGVVNYTLNGLDNTNTVTIPLSNNGEIQVEANNSDTDVRLIAVGYYSPSGTLRYFPVTPCAVADTRSGSGAFAGKQAAGAAYPDVDVVGTFNLTGDNQGGGQTDCLIPGDALSVMVNAVAIQGSGGSGGLALGVGGSEPTEPTTNFTTISLNNAAASMIPVDANGKIATNITSQSGSPETHVRLVVLGYYKISGGDDYVPVNPCAAFDSRTTVAGDTNIPTGLFAGKRIAGTSGVNTTGTTTYNVTGAVPAAQGGELDCGVPTGASAVLINLVAIQPDSVGNFRAFANGSLPTGGVLNFASLSPIVNNSNAVVVPINGFGDMDVFINSPVNDGSPTVHARGVILGYFVP